MSLNICNQSDNHILLIADPSSKDALKTEHFNPQFLKDNNLIEKVSHGRGAVYFFALGPKEVVLRHYRRGGLMAKVSDDKFWWKNIHSSRVYRELSLLTYLQEKKLNTPKPIAGLIQKSGLFYSCDILTKAIPNAQELHLLIQEQAISKSIWSKVGEAVALLHKAKVWHPDINVKNVLLDDSEQVFLIDFDKCERRDGTHWRQENLSRFKRSLEKQKSRFKHYYYDESCWIEIYKAYRFCIDD